MTKYNIGDKVRVRTDLSKSKRYYMADKSISDDVVDEMMKFAGKVVTITRAEIKYGIEECRWSWTDEMFEGKVNENKIVITTDGTETLARLYEGDKVIKRAVAKCLPDDTFNFEIGAKLAFDRLIGNKPAEKWRVVNRPAKAGDYIRLKQNDYPNINDMGDILLVHNVLDDLVKVKNCNHKRPLKTVDDKYLWAYEKREYEVVEPIDAPEEKPKYYNGNVLVFRTNEEGEVVYITSMAYSKNHKKFNCHDWNNKAEAKKFSVDANFWADIPKELILR